MTLLAGEQVEVGRLRARGAPRDTPALRAAVESRVRAGDVRPPGLPPAAILIVRCAEVAPALRPWADRDGRWSRACRERLAAAAADAVRPVRGVLPDGAEAVWFRDEAELLACLALDVADGVTARRWWWRVPLARLGSAAASPAALLAAHAEAAPAVLAELRRAEQDVRVLATVDEASAAVVLRAVANAHGLPVLVEAADALLTHGPAAKAPAVRRHGVPPPTRARAPGSRRESPDAPGPASLAPWEPWLALPAAPVPLGPLQRLLLAAGLLVHAHPAAARSAAFAVALRRWTGGESTRPASPSLPRQEPARRDASAPAGDVEPAVLRPDERVAQEPVGRDVRTELPTPPVTAEAADAAAATEHGSTEPGGPPDAPPRAEETVATGLAGAFYLVNVINRLGLPADEDVTAALGAWGLLETLARGLLEDAPDPLWALLARLGGREPDEPLGAGLPGSARADAPLLAALSPGARVWLACTLPGVRRWLGGELELAEEHVAGELLVRRGTVHETRTHVDVVLAIDSISLPVRRAGLDADPGWDAAFGRVIRLHFEDLA